MSGTANDWPFLYQGGEKEFTDPGPLYYSGGGQFYSPQLVRSMSETSQTSSNGNNGGPAGNGIAAPSGGGAFLVTLGLIWGSDATTGFLVTVAAIVGSIVDALVQLFLDIFGGGSSPTTPRQLLHARHPLYPLILGIQNGLVPTEDSPVYELSSQQPALPSLGSSSDQSDDSFEEPSGEPPGSNALPAGYVIPVRDLKAPQDPEFWKNGPWIEPWMMEKWAKLRHGRKVIPIRPPAVSSGTNLIDPSHGSSYPALIANL